VDERNTGGVGIAGRARRVHLAVQQHLPAIRCVHAAHQVHQCALAGAVFADQPQHLAARHAQCDVFQHAHAKETFLDVLKG